MANQFTLIQHYHVAKTRRAYLKLSDTWLEAKFPFPRNLFFVNLCVFSTLCIVCGWIMPLSKHKLSLSDIHFLSFHYLPFRFSFWCFLINALFNFPFFWESFNLFRVTGNLDIYLLKNIDYCIIIANWLKNSWNWRVGD